MQSCIRNHSWFFFGVIRLPYYGWLITESFQMTIKAVLRNIQFAAGKPLNFRLFEIPFQHFIPFSAPVKMLSDLCPETFGIFDALSIGFFIFFVRSYLIWARHHYSFLTVK